jgi:hypothetical protein
MRTPGFLGILQSQLEGLPLETLERVNSPGGLELRDILEFLINPKDHTVHLPYEVTDDNIFSPLDDQVSCDHGDELLTTGKVAVCFIANDDCLRNISRLGITALESYLSRVSLAKRIWLIVPPISKLHFENALVNSQIRDKVKIVPQFESLCLTPDNRLHVDGQNVVFHPCGSGDSIPSLKREGLLEEFLSDGGEHILFVDADNFLGIPTPSLIYDHVVSDCPVTCLITKGSHNDSAPVICEHAGFNQVIERFRFSSYTEIEFFKYISTGTYIVDARINFDDIAWKWHRRKKVVGTNMVVQYHRYIDDLTSSFKTRFVIQDRGKSYLQLRSYQTSA